MKTIKFILPVIAFAMAIVSVFASSNLLVDNARGINPSTSVCQPGELQIPAGKTCNTTNNDVRCQVRILVGGEPQNVPAFTLGGTCDTDPSEAIFYEN